MKISIIVPIYNVQQYVVKCIDSLLSQTHDDLVIYAISDGSKDESIKIIKEKFNDNRLLIFEKENGGYGSVLEYAIALIDTEYFMICDPDDWLEANAVEKLVEGTRNSEVDIVVANLNYVYSDGVIRCQKVYTKFHPIEAEKTYSELGEFAYVGKSPHAKLYRTQLVKKLRFPRKVNYTDQLLYYYAYSNAKKMIYVDCVLANYFIDRPGNSMSEKKMYSRKTFEDEITVWEYIDRQVNLNSPNIGVIWLCLLQDLVKTYSYIALNEMDNDPEVEISLCTQLKKVKKHIKEITHSVHCNSFVRTFAKKVVVFIGLHLPDKICFRFLNHIWN